FLILPHFTPPLFPYTTLFRSVLAAAVRLRSAAAVFHCNRGLRRNLRSSARLRPLLPGSAHLHVSGVSAAGKVLRAHHGGEVLCRDRKSTRLNSSHQIISYAVF